MTRYTPDSSNTWVKMPRECTVSGSDGRSLIVRLDPGNQRSCIRIPDSQSVVSPPDEELRVTHVSEWFWNCKIVPLLRKLNMEVSNG